MTDIVIYVYASIRSICICLQLRSRAKPLDQSQTHSKTVHSLSVRMDSKNVEERLKVLEERTDEWHATLRVRIVGATALPELGVELASGTREYWKLKVETAELLLIDIEPLMPMLFPEVSQCNSIHQEFKECLAHPDFVYGVFPISGKWGSEKSLDLRMRAGLYGLCSMH